MFLYSIVLAIILGFLLKGNFKNLGHINLSGLYLVIIGFCMDETMHQFGKHHIIKIGMATYAFDLLMYVLIAAFVYMNRKDIYILIIGFGFFLNAIAIFANGGAMPVSATAMAGVSINNAPASHGLYEFLGANTKFWYLCDVISSKYLRGIVFSIGDIISAVGIMLIIVMGMRGKYIKAEIFTNRGRRSRKSRRMRKDMRFLKH